MKGRRPALLALITLATSTAALLPRAARADAPSKAECVASHAESQRLRREGKLRAARDQLLVCANPACPQPVTVECVPWLGEVERAIPTVVFEARLADGSDAVDVTVSVDGVKVAEKLEGRALPVDPGAHLVRFESATAAHPIERRVVIAEGEKTRVVRADFAPAALLEPVPPPAPSSSSTTSAGGAPHWSTWVLAGATVASFGGYAYFGLTGESDESGLNACKPLCYPDKTDPVRHEYIAANVFLGVGIAAAAAAIVVGLTTRGHAASADPASLPAARAGAAQVPSFDRSMLK